MDGNSEKAFEFALATTKQVMALATGILAISVTFLTDVVTDIETSSPGVLISSWVALLVCVLFGVRTMMALTGQLGNKQSKVDNATIYAGPVRLYAGLQMVSFLVGLILIVVFGISAIRGT